MRTRAAAVAAVLVLLVASATQAQDALVAQAEAAQGYSLTLTPTQATYVAGQSVPVVMTLLNVTKAPLTEADGGDCSRRLHTRFMIGTSDGKFTPIEQRVACNYTGPISSSAPRDLAPGESVATKFDLAIMYPALPTSGTISVQAQMVIGTDHTTAMPLYVKSNTITIKLVPRQAHLGAMYAARYVLVAQARSIQHRVAAVQCEQSPEICVNRNGGKQRIGGEE